MTKSKLTLGQIEPVTNACVAALNHQRPFGVRIKLREALRALSVHGQDFDKERAELIDKYVTKDADGQPLVVDGKIQFDGNEAEVDRLWRELVGTEIVVEHNLKLADVADLPGDAALDALELLIA